MFGAVTITTNTSGIPFVRTSSVSVGTEAVDFALGFRRIPLMGYITINIADAIPTGTTGTLPVRFTLNGNTRALTTFGGDAVTAEDLVGTGIITVFHNWYDGTLQAVSPLTTA